MLKRDRCRHEYATGPRHEEEIRAELKTGSESIEGLMPRMFVGRRRTWGQKRGSMHCVARCFVKYPKKRVWKYNRGQVHDKRCRRSLRLRLVGMPLLQQIFQWSVLGCESVEQHSRHTSAILAWWSIMMFAKAARGLLCFGGARTRFGERSTAGGFASTAPGQRDRDEALLSPGES